MVSDVEVAIVFTDPDLYPEDQPLQMTDGSLGIDLRARIDESLTLVPECMPDGIPTGIRIAIPEGYVGLVCPRSSMGKRGLLIPNAPGVIDQDFRGEIKVLLMASSNCPYEHTINRGDRIAQLVIVPSPKIKLVRRHSLSETGRGSGGFGSTGV